MAQLPLCPCQGVLLPAWARHTMGTARFDPGVHYHPCSAPYIPVPRHGVQTKPTWVMVGRLPHGPLSEAGRLAGLTTRQLCRFGAWLLFTLLKAPIYVPQAHGSCSFSLRVFPQGLSIHGTSVLLCLTKH